MHPSHVHGLYSLSPESFVISGLQVKNGRGTEGDTLLCFTSDPHFLRVPCWKITLFVIVPVLGPLVALIICYNWLHRRLAGSVSGQQNRTAMHQGTQADQYGKRVEPRF